MTNKGITRRQVIRDVTRFTIAGSLFLNFPISLFGQSEPKKTKVILIRNKDVVDDKNKTEPDIIQKMIDKALMELTGKTEYLSAWQKIIQPSDIVGIKSNVWSHLSTPPELENAIKKRLLEVGVRDNKISIADRKIRKDPVFQKSTALINVRPLRTHHWAGAGTLIKNYIMFAKKPFTLHGDSCANLAKVWEYSKVKGKTRLNILVMLTPLFHGIGPHHFNKKYIWQYKGLLVGFDPVAVDSVGLRILMAKRKSFFGEDHPLRPPAKHVYMADTRHHLGTADPAKIDLVKLGWKEDIFI